MALGPIAEIAIGWGRCPANVPRHLFHGVVGIAIGWGHRATVAALAGRSQLSNGGIIGSASADVGQIRDERDVGPFFDFGHD